MPTNSATRPQRTAPCRSGSGTTPRSNGRRPRNNSAPSRNATGTAGCAILPFGGHFAPEYLSDEYFALYGEIVREAPRGGARPVALRRVRVPERQHGRHQRRRHAALHAASSGGDDKTGSTNSNTRWRPGTECDIELPRDGRLMALVAMDASRGRYAPCPDAFPAGAYAGHRPRGHGNCSASCA